MPFSYADARPNETKLLARLEECGTDWEEVAKSLLSWLSDDDVKEWAEANDYQFEEEDK